MANCGRCMYFNMGYCTVKAALVSSSSWRECSAYKKKTRKERK